MRSYSPALAEDSASVAAQAWQRRLPQPRALSDLARQDGIPTASSARAANTPLAQVQRCGPVPCDCSPDERARDEEELAAGPDAENQGQNQVTVSRLVEGGERPPRRLNPADILRLQRTAGNAGVAGVLAQSARERAGEISARQSLQRTHDLVVQRNGKTKDPFGDPVSAGMTAAFDGLAFEPAGGGVFSPGPKPPQLVAIVAKRLAGGSYTPALGKSLYAWQAGRKFSGWGGFKSGSVAKTEEPIGTIHVGLRASLEAIAFLHKKNVKVDVTKEQEELLALGRTTFDLWADVLNEAKKTGKPLPPWYGKMIFDMEMGQHGTLLRAYRAALEAHRGGDQTGMDKGMAAVRDVLASISGPAMALDAIRIDTGLATDAKTKDSYQALWGPAAGATPEKLANVQLAVLFLSWSRSQPESMAKAPTDGKARATMMERFFSFGHDVTFTPMTGDQKIRDIPATANARPFDAILSSSPPLQPPLFDAAYGTDHRFTMSVQFPDVTDALAVWAYNWERVKIPEDQIGAPVEKLKGDKPTAGEVASVRFGRATQYAVADLKRAASDMQADLGPPGAGATTLIAANAILRYVGTGIRLALELLTMPENERPIVFPEPGLYMVRCAASPVFKGETVIKRAPSVAYYPVLARDPNEMATAGVETALKSQKANQERIAELRAALAKPAPPEIKADLQKELDALLLAAGPMGAVLEGRMNQIDQYLADIKAGKVEGSVEDVEKQKAQLKKIMALRTTRKLGDKAERLTATFVSDTGQRMSLDLEALDKPAGGGRHAIYVSDTTTAKSGAETGYGKTRADAIANGLKKILEGIAGYGRGRVAVQIGDELRTLRIEASLGSLLMESIENVATVVSIAAVAAAPFTGGASLALLIPVGIVGAVPSAYRIAVKVEHGTFEPDLESAMDVVNIVGSVVGLGRVGATSLRMVRLGKAMMFLGFGADALGGLLMGADLVAKLDEVAKMPEGERAAALMMIIGQAMMAVGITVGGALAERASQRHAEAKARGKAGTAGEEIFTKAKTEQDIAKLGPMTEETKGMLRQNEPLRNSLAEHPSAANALKKCASSCFPPNATPQQVQRLEEILGRLKETGKYDESALKEYFHKRADSLDEAIAKIAGVETAADLDMWVRFYNGDGKITRLPPKGDPKELSARAGRSHDIGVAQGKLKAAADGMTPTGFDNPIKGGTFGQGFDDIMHTGPSLDLGDVYIVEYKGGKARLAEGQMTLDWVIGNIRRLALEGGPTGQAWARVLSKALREGRLKGVAYKTPIVGNASLPTYKIDSWSYPKRSI